MDQSQRYAKPDLDETQLMAAGRHVLCAYHFKPKAAASRSPRPPTSAAESSTGTNVEVCTTDDFTRTVDALVIPRPHCPAAIG